MYRLLISCIWSLNSKKFSQYLTLWTSIPKTGVVYANVCYWKRGEGKGICCKSVEKYIIHPKSFWGVTYVKKGPSKASVVFSCPCSHQYVFAIFNTCQSDKFLAPLLKKHILCDDLFMHPIGWKDFFLFPWIC